MVQVAVKRASSDPGAQHSSNSSSASPSPQPTMPTTAAATATAATAEFPGGQLLIGWCDIPSHRRQWWLFLSQSSGGCVPAGVSAGHHAATWG